MAATVEPLLLKLRNANYVIRYLRCDNAGENIKGLSVMCDRLNITIKFTAPHTPQQRSGMVERKFVTIGDRSVAAMLKAKFSDESQALLWAENINTHTHTPHK